MEKEKTVIKKNFMDHTHRVKPIQNVFHDENCEADANVLRFFSKFQMGLMGALVDGACTLSKHRNGESVVPKDLLCYLDIYWNIDPILVSEDFYSVGEIAVDDSETTDDDDDDLSIPIQERLQGQHDLKTVRPSTSKVKKVSVRKSKPKFESKPKTSKIKSKKLKSETITKNQDICYEQPVKITLPPSNKKPELKGKKRASTKMLHPDSKVSKISNKKGKRKVSDSVESPAEARKRLAIILLRIAGKY